MSSYFILDNSLNRYLFVPDTDNVDNLFQDYLKMLARYAIILHSAEYLLNTFTGTKKFLDDVGKLFVKKTDNEISLDMDYLRTIFDSMKRSD